MDTSKKTVSETKAQKPLAESVKAPSPLKSEEKPVSVANEINTSAEKSKHASVVSEKKPEPKASMPTGVLPSAPSVSDKAHAAQNNEITMTQETEKFLSEKQSLATKKAVKSATDAVNTPKSPEMILHEKESTEAIIEPAPLQSDKAPVVQAKSEQPAQQEPPAQHHHQEHHQQRPHRDSLYIIQITPELAPLAKVGGLGDVVTGLSRELEVRGNNVEIILPKYDCMRYDHIWGLCETMKDLWVPWYGGSIHCTVYFGFVHGRKCFFIEPHSSDNFFNRGCFYGNNDDIFRFAFFSRAAIEFMWKAGKHPDIIHCHDWQTALVPVFLYEIYQHMGMHHPRVCYTIHNFRHQGVHGVPLLNATGLNRSDYYFHNDRLKDNHNPHGINCMKGGIVYSNFVTTVSPRHAWEARNEGQGFGLEPTLHTHHYKYGGVVNGVDYDVWNPEIDRYIPHHYGVNNIDGKYANKKALRNRLWLADNEKPIVAFVGRLDPQKGLDLVRHAIFHTLYLGGQFVLLGSSPEHGINSYFWELKRHLNDSPDCHLEIGYNEDLAHLIYAGADLIIVPSRYEPCGLTQLISMRYGTLPIVRSCGGLADTVFDKDFSDRALDQRNGFVFHSDSNSGIESALTRAIACYYQFPADFRAVMKNAMQFDYSWNHPGEHYLNIYDYIRNR